MNNHKKGQLYKKMFIQTEDTPNPQTLKFMPGEIILTEGTRDYRSAVEAEESPLATRLFGIKGVSGVFLAKDFLSVTKAADAPWLTLKPLVLGAIMDHLVSKQPILKSLKASSSAAAESREEDSEVVHQIKELLEKRIRPAVAMDGGDIVFVKFEDGIVYLNLQGACSGCPSSTVTLKSGIENMLKHYVPEVIEVQAISDTAS